MDKTQKQKLKEFVKMGKWNYVFTYGVVRWGMLCALLIILFEKFILDKRITEFDVTLNIIIWGIGGLIFGVWTWNSINKKLQEK